MNSRPIASVSAVLNGLSAGVGVTQSSGQPGTGATIRIRGTGTLNNSNPLVLVDGVSGIWMLLIPMILKVSVY